MRLNDTPNAIGCTTIELSAQTFPRMRVRVRVFMCVFTCTRVGEWVCGCVRACVYMCGVACLLCACCVHAACVLRVWVCVRQRASMNAVYRKEYCVLKF